MSELDKLRERYSTVSYESWWRIALDEICEAIWKDVDALNHLDYDSYDFKRIIENLLKVNSPQGSSEPRSSGGDDVSEITPDSVKGLCECGGEGCPDCQGDDVCEACEYYGNKECPMKDKKADDVCECGGKISKEAMTCRECYRKKFKKSVKPKVYIEKAGNMTRDGAKAIKDTLKEDCANLVEETGTICGEPIDEDAPYPAYCTKCRKKEKDA